MVKRHGGTQATENAVDAALQWLAANQQPDGHWDSVRHGATHSRDVAVTSLALLTFLNAGHTEKIGKHQKIVRKAVAWLISKQDREGAVRLATDAPEMEGLSAALSTLALVEAAEMAHVSETRAAAEKALRYLSEVYPRAEGKKEPAWGSTAKATGDTEITAWAMMAMRSATAANLEFSQAAMHEADAFFSRVEVKTEPETILFKETVVSTKGHSRTIAAAVMARIHWKYTTDEIEPAVNAFLAAGGTPKWDENGTNVDAMYWHFGTLATFQYGGQPWKDWNKAMIEALVPSQITEGENKGSWQPVGETGKQWCRVGQTALLAQCLQVYYRYHQITK